MSDIVFLDTETTGLSLEDDIWEFAAIRRYESGEQQQWQFFIDHDRVKCARLPLDFRDDHYSRFADHLAYSRAQAASEMQRATNKAHIVGAVPNFDTERMALLFKATGYTPHWHYHLIDVETLAVGWLRALNRAVPELPWDSNELSLAVGVDPDQFQRHTALGDVLWAQAIYDRVTTGAR